MRYMIIPCVTAALLGVSAGNAFAQMFGSAEARAQIEAMGLTLQGEPVPVKRHFEATVMTRSGPRIAEVHRDGEVTIWSQVDSAERLAMPMGTAVPHVSAPHSHDGMAAFTPAQAKAMVVARGYNTVGEPIQIKRHYEFNALTADGRPIRLHVHRDGRVFAPGA